MAILFHLRWQILVGLERHYIRKPPGPVVATGSAVTKAGSLPTWYLEEEKIYSKYGNKDFLLKNIEVRDPRTRTISSAIFAKDVL